MPTEIERKFGEIDSKTECEMCGHISVGVGDNKNCKCCMCGWKTPDESEEILAEVEQEFAEDWLSGIV
jgi:hypothetical protein